MSREDKYFPKVELFLDEIYAICKKYNLSLSHEDCQGGFIIEPYKEANIDWLDVASVNLISEEVGS